MRIRIALTALLFANAFLCAQDLNRAPESERQPGPPDTALVASGRQAFVSNCSFCHGVTAHGGAQGGPDLTQSSLVRADEDGKQLGAFLKIGRPDKGMPAFDLTHEKVQAIAAFLHSAIQSAPQRQSFGKQVIVGDAAAGKAFFEGEGECARCHSATGDLKGVGSRYQPAILQGRLVLPVGHGGYPGFSPSDPLTTRVTVVQPDGRTLSGLLVYLSDYAVTLVDSSGERWTVPRHGSVPKVVTKDPLQAHLDRLLILTDRQMHDLNAYLATLK